jgi:hypothetical protein
MRCTRLRSPSLEVGPRRERVSLRFDLATTCYIHCKKNFKKFVFLGCTIIQDVIGSSAVLATNRSAYHHYSNDSSCTTQWASESGTTSSSVCLTYRAGFSVVCFTRDRVGSALYSFGHGLHSYLVHFSTSDGHPCLQESRCYLQWAHRIAYTTRVQNPCSYHSCSSHQDYWDDSVVCCFVRAASDSHSYSWGFSDSDRTGCSSTSYSVTFRATGRADPDRFTSTSSDRGSDCLEFRVRGWCSSVLDLSPHHSAWLVCSYPIVWPLGFGAWRQRGRGSKYVRFRVSMWDGLDSFVCDTSYIHVYFHASCYIHVSVRPMWHVCSLLWYLYVMSLGYAHLPCFRISLRFKWASLNVLMLNSYLLSTPC